MNEKKNTSHLSIKNSNEISHRDVAVSTESSGKLDDGQATTRSTEDDFGLLSTSDDKVELKDREPIFVIVDSSCISNPSSRELLIEDKIIKGQTVMRKYFNKHVQPIDMPSTSRDFQNSFSPLKQSDSSDELQMIDINLQSENEIPVDENEIDEESIVLSYLRNKVAHLDREELSETSLDVLIPSYPGSPRSFNFASRDSLASSEEEDIMFKQAVDYLHHDNEFLDAAEVGDSKLLEILISRRKNIHQLDHLGRNALHLAVCSGHMSAVLILLKAGVNPNVKDNLGMTPLSLCLLRSPSVGLVNLLFNHGAKLLPRISPMDTGLFLQFAMTCTPTAEDEKILDLLIEKGALVNDPDAPGGRQALHIAAMGNNCELINVLVNLGADLYLTNHRGETPKEFAVTFKCKEAYSLLEELEKEFPIDSNTSSSILSSSESSVTLGSTIQLNARRRTNDTT